MGKFLQEHPINPVMVSLRASMLAHALFLVYINDFLMVSAMLRSIVTILLSALNVTSF